jgi:hypothetical protein
MTSKTDIQRNLYATSGAALGCTLLVAFTALFCATSLSAQSAASSRAQSTLAKSLHSETQEIDTLALRAHTHFLANDLLEGRGTGTRGERLGANYIESQLIALGVEGAGEGGAYRIPLPLRSAMILPTSQMTLVRGSQGTEFLYGDPNFIVNTGGARAFRDFEGDVLYAGVAASALSLLRSSQDLTGKVIAFNGPLGGAAVSIVPLLIERGAAGILVLVDDPANFDLYVRSRGDRRFFVNADVADAVWQPDIPVILAGRPVIRALFQGAPPAAAASSLTGVVPLGAHVRIAIRTQMQDVPAANVAGIIRGTDPKRRNDVVVYTAHYDHLGISTPDARGDSIYNGFSDDAAGCAMLLAIAEAFRRKPPAYSVAFFFFTGEERGLLGSSYMAARPPFPLSRIRAMIEFDGGAPPVPPVSWRLAGGAEVPSLGASAVDIAARAGWKTTLSGASPNSDYWEFLHRGVPSVFIIPGDEWENTSAAERTALQTRWNHYHEAADEWSADFPFAGLARYAAYALALGRAAMGSPPARN